MPSHKGRIERLMGGLTVLPVCYQHTRQLLVVGDCAMCKWATSSFYVQSAVVHDTTMIHLLAQEFLLTVRRDINCAALILACCDQMKGWTRLAAKCWVYLALGLVWFSIV